STGIIPTVPYPAASSICGVRGRRYDTKSSGGSGTTEALRGRTSKSSGGRLANRIVARNRNGAAVSFNVRFGDALNTLNPILATKKRSRQCPGALRKA